MSDEKEPQKPLIAIAGATGFVGTHLRKLLETHFRIRALTRSSNAAKSLNKESITEWRQCDLYSLPKLSEAMQGCSIGIYLVHSMAPSSRLVQASFEDTDLLLADNFIRAAKSVGIKHVVYLGGLMPKDETEVSPHLNSRREVEHVLGSLSVTLTVLRAGLILGPGGSSFSMLVNLVRRLPLMLLPAWTRSTTQSIDIADICRAIEYSLTDPSLAGGCYDLGCHSKMTYRDLIMKTGSHIGKRIRSVDLPGNLFGLSKRWVSIFGGVPIRLASPLVESLKHNLEARSNPLLDRILKQSVNFEDSIRRSTDDQGRPKANPRSVSTANDANEIKKQKRVLSVQRMELGTEVDAHDISLEYGVWLTNIFAGLIRVKQGEDKVIRFKALRWITLLELAPTPFSMNDKRRCAFYITGGVLSENADPMGRLEFRVFQHSKCLIASIHGYVPTLPWWIYRRTQAVAHLWVMKAFARHLKRLYRIQDKES